MSFYSFSTRKYLFKLSLQDLIVILSGEGKGRTREDTGFMGRDFSTLLHQAIEAEGFSLDNSTISRARSGSLKSSAVISESSIQYVWEQYWTRKMNKCVLECNDTVNEANALIEKLLEVLTMHGYQISNRIFEYQNVFRNLPAEKQQKFYLKLTREISNGYFHPQDTPPISAQLEELMSVVNKSIREISEIIDYQSNEEITPLLRRIRDILKEVQEPVIQADFIGLTLDVVKELVDIQLQLSRILANAEYIVKDKNNQIKSSYSSPSKKAFYSISISNYEFSPTLSQTLHVTEHLLHKVDYISHLIKKITDGCSDVEN